MVIDAREHVCKPCPCINRIELGGLDQRVDRGGAAPAAVGAGEDPVLTPDGDATNGALGRVIRHADAAIIEVAGERRPSFEVIVDRFGKPLLR